MSSPYGAGRRAVHGYVLATGGAAADPIETRAYVSPEPTWAPPQPRRRSALDHQRGPPDRRPRLEHVAVQRREIIQIADPDAENGHPIRPRDAVEPVLRWVVDALTAPVQAAGGRDDLAWQRRELDQLVPRGHRLMSVNRRGPGGGRGHHVNVLRAPRSPGPSPAAPGIDPQPGLRRLLGQGHEQPAGLGPCRGIAPRSLDPSRSRYRARHQGCHRFISRDGIAPVG